MELKMGDPWKIILENEIQKSYFKLLTNFINIEYKTQQCFPPKDLIFSAFEHCCFKDLKVVIIGQDPYHDENQANGLCFSVKNGTKHPPSLKNIFKELESDLKQEVSENGDLEKWATQGVLLLNATLTVRAHAAGSHQNKGWETFTNAVITEISDTKENIVFLLWGKFAESKTSFIDTKKHQIFTAPHPSPLGAWRGWFGSKHFSKTNAFLKSIEKKEINW
jgi:uracil-DNA glycosylase